MYDVNTRDLCYFIFVALCAFFSFFGGVFLRDLVGFSLALQYSRWGSGVYGTVSSVDDGVSVGLGVGVRAFPGVWAWGRVVRLWGLGILWGVHLAWYGLLFGCLRLEVFRCLVVFLGFALLRSIPGGEGRGTFLGGGRVRGIGYR
jgi:hypothetical protein